MTSRRRRCRVSSGCKSRLPYNGGCICQRCCSGDHQILNRYHILNKRGKYLAVLCAEYKLLRFNGTSLIFTLSFSGRSWNKYQNHCCMHTKPYKGTMFTAFFKIHCWINLPGSLPPQKLASRNTGNVSWPLNCLRVVTVGFIYTNMCSPEDFLSCH